MFEKYSAANPAQRVRLTREFAFASPAHIIATFCGCGVLHPAPGTWGTLAGLLVYLLLQNVIAAGVWVVLIVGFFFVGAWASEIAGRDLGIHDHGGFVIDEVVAIWMVLLCLPQTMMSAIAGFLAFRFFDIVKIFPASYFDSNARWQNGWGVMLDDIAAGIYSLLLVRLLA